MQPTDLIITNILATGTAFAVVADDMTQNVFIPSRLSLDAGLAPNQRVSANIVPNISQPEKTPWVAIHINRTVKPQAEPVISDNRLAERIIDDLREGGMATVDNVAESLDHPMPSVMAKMQELARRGLIHRRVYYAADEADFEPMLDA